MKTIFVSVHVGPGVTLAAGRLPLAFDGTLVATRILLRPSNVRQLEGEIGPAGYVKAINHVMRYGEVDIEVACLGGENARSKFRLREAAAQDDRDARLCGRKMSRGDEVKFTVTLPEPPPDVVAMEAIFDFEESAAPTLH